MLMSTAFFLLLMIDYAREGSDEASNVMTSVCCVDGWIRKGFAGRLFTSHTI